MSRPTALELLQAQETWTQLSALGSSSTALQGAARHAISFDVRQLINDGSPAWARQNGPSSTNGNGNGIKRSLETIRYVLGKLWTTGIKSSLDVECTDKLSLVYSSPSACALSTRTMPFCQAEVQSALDAWSTSAKATADRLLALVALLRVFLNFPADAIAFYSVELPMLVSHWQRPSLDVLAAAWTDISADVQQAARQLLATTIASMPRHQLSRESETRHRLLSSSQTLSSAERTIHLLVLGQISTSNYKLLAPNVLKDLSTWTIAGLRDFSLPDRQLVCVELCSQSFTLLGVYIDIVQLVEALFALATGLDERTSADLRAAARTAAIHVASLNTSLFVSTLASSLLRSRTPAHRNATLKFCAVLLRKKPILLMPSLPRLVEAIVASLDPSGPSKLREAVQQTVALVLVELSRTYPFVDVHDGLQRLAIGTAEGAIVMYDLRTGTRLYVLDAHKAEVSACAFSPDGRRLVSASLDENKAVVYKVGSSVLSMLRPGAPPRQGNSGGEPYKTLNFFYVDDLPRASKLELVSFDWPSQRSARLRIREINITFETS